MEDLETSEAIQAGQGDDNPFQRMIPFQGRNDFSNLAVNHDLTSSGLHFGVPSDFVQIDLIIDPFESKALRHFGQRLIN